MLAKAPMNILPDTDDATAPVTMVAIDVLSFSVSPILLLELSLIQILYWQILDGNATALR
jgi:hypothetical protein